MGTVIKLDRGVVADPGPDEVLEGAKGALEIAVVVGMDHDGALYFAGSTERLDQVAWLLDLAKYQVMQMATEE